MTGETSRAVEGEMKAFPSPATESPVELKDLFTQDHILHWQTIQEIVGKSKLYVVFFTGRSGSTWLTDLAASTRLLGVPDEFLNDVRYIAATYQNINEAAFEVARNTRTSNGVVGVEFSYSQTMTLCEMLDAPVRAV